MKVNNSIRERIAAVLSGLILIAAAVCFVTEAFFGAGITGALGALLADKGALSILLTLLIVLVLLVLGVCCLIFAMPKRIAGKRGFVMQKTENGAIGISIRSIEGLVATCMKKHDMIERSEIAVTESRDGIIILLDITQAAGVNIPLSVGVLQKQIRTYVTACTGVEVQEVRVMVENNETTAVESPFVVQDTIAIPPAVLSQKPEAVALPEEEEEIIEDAAAAVMTVPAIVSAAAPVVTAVMPDLMADEDDDRPLHQRLFGMEEQPAIVPAPPELTEEAEEESAEDTAEDAPISDEPAEADAAAEEAEPAQAAEELPVLNEDANLNWDVYEIETADKTEETGDDEIAEEEEIF